MFQLVFFSCLVFRVLCFLSGYVAIFVPVFSLHGVFFGRKGHVHVGQVYLSSLIPMCCSKRIAVGYFLLQCGHSTGFRATGFHAFFALRLDVRLSYFVVNLFRAQSSMLNFRSCASCCHLANSICPHISGRSVSGESLLVRLRFAYLFRRCCLF